MQPIEDVARALGLRPDHAIPYGRNKLKVSLDALVAPPKAPGRLVLVSAVTPTRAGEGKTTTTVGLAMGLCRLGRRAVACLREPSLGPVFGMKGGGTGGGRAQLVPADDINLHFTGDLHAISSAHNLLAALLDNALHFGLPEAPDPRRIVWPRVMDMNDRALRDVLVGLGGTAHGVPRETRFDITAASEVMAILCLTSGPSDLVERLSRVVIGYRSRGEPVRAADLGAEAAMGALLQHALAPNLVQTSEGTPAIVHGGPFANIAHGCSSVIATRLGLAYADDVVTEAGFGFDLGGEKFLDIKWRQAGLWPSAVVLVTTARALASHGRGFDVQAVRDGLAHLDRQLESVRNFGLQAVVAINVFDGDDPSGLAAIEQHCRDRGVAVARCTAYADGGVGAEPLARTLLETLDGKPASQPRFLYELGDSYEQKLHAIATSAYGADGVTWAPGVTKELRRLEDLGYAGLPICVAKTHLSLTDDPTRPGAPRGFTVHVSSIRLSAGAGFIVALMGDIMTMPGLPREPAARQVRIEADGRVRGLMQND